MMSTSKKFHHRKVVQETEFEEQVSLNPTSLSHIYPVWTKKMTKVAQIKEAGTKPLTVTDLFLSAVEEMQKLAETRMWTTLKVKDQIMVISIIGN